MAVGGRMWSRNSPMVHSGLTCEAHLLWSCRREYKKKRVKFNVYCEDKAYLFSYWMIIYWAHLCASFHNHTSTLYCIYIFSHCIKADASRWMNTPSSGIKETWIKAQLCPIWFLSTNSTNYSLSVSYTCRWRKKKNQIPPVPIKCVKLQLKNGHIGPKCYGAVAWAGIKFY